MLKTLGSTECLTRLGKSVVGVDGDSKAGHNGSKLDRTEIDDGEIGGGKVDNEVGKKDQKTSKSKNLFKSKKLSKSKKAIGSSDFLTFRTKLAFTELKQAFLKAPILHHFDPERHIWIEADVSDYAIGEILSQLTSDNLGQWHPMLFFSYKMILAETRYKTYDGELLAIVEAFKTWINYLESSQHEMLVLTNYNNLCRFMDAKSLSSRQVCWTQQFSDYHFRINY